MSNGDIHIPVGAFRDGDYWYEIEISKWEIGTGRVWSYSNPLDVVDIDCIPDDMYEAILKWLSKRRPSMMEFAKKVARKYALKTHVNSL